MVAIGLKGLPSERFRTCNLVEDSLMGEENQSYKHGRKKKGLGRNATKESFGFDGNNSNKFVSGPGADGTVNGRKSWKHHNASEPQTSVVRKQVDPELAKYFSEIANLFESSEVELEEQSVLCRNVLEETRGKEFELATDYIISHILQMLLEGCDVDHLCCFFSEAVQMNFLLLLWIDLVLMWPSQLSSLYLCIFKMNRLILSLKKI